MIWPGMGDPSKRRKTIRYLIITAVIGVGVAALSSGVQILLSSDNPLKVCINGKDTHYKITANIELYVDHEKKEIPAKIGWKDECKRALYTTSNDGTIYAEWKEEYPFEIGHFLWIADFPIRDMDDSKSKIFVNGKEAPEFIRTPLIDGNSYRAEFVTKTYDESIEHDFAPPK